MHVFDVHSWKRFNGVGFLISHERKSSLSGGRLARYGVGLLKNLDANWDLVKPMLSERAGSNPALRAIYSLIHHALVGLFYH